MKNIFIPSSAINSANKVMVDQGMNPLLAVLMQAKAKVLGLRSYCCVNVKGHWSLHSVDEQRQVTWPEAYAVSEEVEDVDLLDMISREVTLMYPGTKTGLGTDLWNRHSANGNQAIAA